MAAKHRRVHCVRPLPNAATSCMCRAAIAEKNKRLLVAARASPAKTKQHRENVHRGASGSKPAPHRTRLCLGSNPVTGCMQHGICIFIYEGANMTMHPKASRTNIITPAHMHESSGGLNYSNASWRQDAHRDNALTLGRDNAGLQCRRHPARSTPPLTTAASRRGLQGKSQEHFCHEESHVSRTRPQTVTHS